MAKPSWNILIDTGGTFTDCLAVDPNGTTRRAKVLSNSALRGEIVEQLSSTTFAIKQQWNAPSGFVEGFRFRLLSRGHEIQTVTRFDAGTSVLELDKAFTLNHEELPGASFELLSGDEAPVLAARLITGTLPGQPLPELTMRLATTRGTNALLEGTGGPVALFVTAGFGDLPRIGTQQRPDLFALYIEKPEALYHSVIGVEERMDAEGRVLIELEPETLLGQAEQLLKQGVRTACIAFMHSYKNPAHEQALTAWLRGLGFKHVSVSSELSPFIKLLPRLQTALVNAWLNPVLREYLDSIQSATPGSRLHLMTSAGGLVSASAFTPKDSLLSGPAGGVVGASVIGRQAGYERVISFDMGGTSTDAARFDDDFEYTFEHRVGEAVLSAPALAIETVAAGGGSICSFDGHRMRVGPESAGASPGPACYGAGGPLTITDVNLLLGRLDARNFDIPLSADAARSRFDELLEQMDNGRNKPVNEHAVLMGLLDIANERMAGAIHKISLRKGYDPAEYTLVSFGGAGAQHACAIARRLNMQRVLIPADAGLLSAFGLGHAVIEQFAERQILEPLHQVQSQLLPISEILEKQAVEQVRQQVDDTEPVDIRRRLLFMRLEGQESTLEIEWDHKTDPEKTFRKAYTGRYGHWITGRTIEVESMRVIASVRTGIKSVGRVGTSTALPEPVLSKRIHFDAESAETPVYMRDQLKPGSRLSGPALVLDPHSTLVLEPGWTAAVRADLTLELTRSAEPDAHAHASHTEAVSLGLFTHRFTSIAEEMGVMLRRTALSVNVKERLDFSCALLNRRGQLIVNAPHIPVHLGALGVCVRSLMKATEMKPGDVIVTNHPAYGGSHLPDITVVTPVFYEGELIGFAANRAHHAEIGGSRPGSMPPQARHLTEEGVVIPPMYLVKRGEGQWEHIRSRLLSGPWPTRSVEENMADLQAAVAANQQGTGALRQLAQQYGLKKVLHYMDALFNHSSKKMEQVLRAIPDGSYTSEERLDDGTLLKATIEIEQGQIRIDFTGTGDIHPGNLNATPAIVNSVVMYVLRLLLAEPLPLNEGLLEPVQIHLPQCLLNPDFGGDPSRCPAVVGGNTEVSQRLTDMLLKPFGRIACSQGTMNNVLFGNEHFGYYETVGGGTGAGPDFDGADAVHHHMTNTAGTDPEILEYRYPVRLNRYAIRRNSGGKGRHRGGDGIIRELTFLKPVSLSVLTQHRREHPYGLNGGQPGATGRQRVMRKNGQEEILQPIAGCEMQSGDRFILETPGGGGFGKE